MRVCRSRKRKKYQDESTESVHCVGFTFSRSVAFGTLGCIQSASLAKGEAIVLRLFAPELVVYWISAGNLREVGKFPRVVRRVRGNKQVGLGVPAC